MPLTVLVPVVFVGIALVVLLVHLTGGSKAEPFDDARDLRAAFLRDYSHLTVRDMVVADNGGEAVLALEEGGVGLVHRMGRGSATRWLGREYAFTAEAVDDHALHIRVKDLGMAPIVMRFASSDERARAMDMCEGAL